MAIQEHVPVLIVGAGDAGLSLSLLLLQQGIHPLLIERRSEISWIPRARNLNFRTLEVLRGLGLTAEVRAAGARISQVVFRESLSSKQETILDPTAQIEHREATSPDPFGWYCPQNRLEPILLASARQHGGDVRYNTELISFTQDDTEITATLRERTTGETYIIRSNYLAACDGAHSHIRGSLNIPTQGFGALPEYFTFIYFRAPWQEFITGHEADGFIIKNAHVQGIFVVAQEGHGMFMITNRLTQKEAFEGFTAERWKDLILKAIGQEIPVEILDIAHWQPAESIAEQFQKGRVFLVGDAAHTMPAYKGLGANTAIQSAQNLGWKLAAVLKGQAAQELLATYPIERYPVGRFAAHQSLTGPGAAWLPEGTKSQLLAAEKDLPLFYPIIGYCYRSHAILGEAVTPAASDEIVLLDRQELTGLPGTRVPHVWLERQGQRLSTLDLLNGSFILFTGTDGARWCMAATEVKESLRIDLAAYRIGPDADLVDLEHEGLAKMGVSSEGAVLVRPDGFVAWRTNTLTTAPESLLEQVLLYILRDMK